MRKILTLILPVLVIVGCKLSSGNSEILAQLSDSDQDTLENVYSSDAIKIIDDEQILNGLEEISKYYDNNRHKEIFADPLFRITANEGRKIFYEIFDISTSDSEMLKQLVIRQQRNGKEMKVCEFEVKSGDNDADAIIAAIKLRRELWMKFCNAHDVKALVNEVYSENTLYYNHRPLVKGRDALVSEYGYMNSPNYSLELNPIIIEVVNDETVFEIGQCKGSYNGNYILVWKKDPDGKWQILFDSNI